ncbi:hypothetical protein [Adhaeribacter soli]|uniref:Uncharacterized protein n=1 Tax=Adhaeribacter soli TaxID=2607655 RepID=A0A5N1IHQ4_9BACT|nr:hypothetical protein [Adhaeribacter soli]KAA9324918.1 hypothetical protein F0P94_19525 [Adhaeribacter soli]
MFNLQLSIKQKTYALISGSILFGLVIYQLTLKRTIEAYQTNGFLKNQLSEAAEAPDALIQLKSINSNYEKAIIKYRKSATDHEGVLLDRVNKVCVKNAVRITSFNSLPTYKQGNQVVHTGFIKLTGRFTSILQVIFHLETKEAIGRLSSVKFILEKDYNQEVRRLSALVYIQYITLNNSSND